MTITLEPELEQKVQEAAKRAGQDVKDYVSVLLMRQLAAQENAALDHQAGEERLRRQFEAAMNDPLFVQDMEQTMEDYKYIDSDAARMLDGEYGKEDAA